MTSDAEAGCYVDLHLSWIGVGVESLNRLLYIYTEITNRERRTSCKYFSYDLDIRASIPCKGRNYFGSHRV
jgi:hypothetical protein